MPHLCHNAHIVLARRCLAGMFAARLRNTGSQDERGCDETCAERQVGRSGRADADCGHAVGAHGLGRVLGAVALTVATLAASALGGAVSVASGSETRGAISGLVLSSDAAGAVTASWAEPHPEPVDYRVSWARADGAYLSWSDPAGNRYPTATSLELTGLEHGTE